MGMFDYININEKFLPVIPEIINGNYSQSLSSLQTKDFDNALDTYHVGEDGILKIDKVEYELVENKEPTKNLRWNPPFFQQEKSRQKQDYPHTGIISTIQSFGDHQNNTKDDILVIINFKFIDGIIQGVGTVKELMIIPVHEILERQRKYEEMRFKRDNDPIYKLTLFISRIVNTASYYLDMFDAWLRSYQPK